MAFAVRSGYQLLKRDQLINQKVGNLTPVRCWCPRPPPLVPLLPLIFLIYTFFFRRYAKAIDMRKS